MAQNRAVVKSVLSGDTIILRGKPRPNGPPPERLLALSNVQAPRLGNKDKEDEPFAFAARDYLRKLLVGKEVSFQPEYTVSTREYGTVYINSESVTQLGVKEGWLKVRDTRRDASDETVADVEALKKLEAEAVTAKKGIWTENKEEGVRTINYTWTGDAKEFLNKYKGKPVDAIIEQVRDGSTLRVRLLLPDGAHQYITLLITGIKAPTVRKDIPNQEDVIEPFGEQAKYFVEQRLLQRQVQVVLEGLDRNDNFIGSVRHPAGNIAEGLLAAGLAKVADWTLAYLTEGPVKLRSAESAAKEKRLCLWQAFVAKEKTEDQNFTAQVVKIVSGDTILVSNTKTGVEKKLQLASIKQAPKGESTPGAAGSQSKTKSKEIKETGYQWEAREFLRKKLIGKNVHVTIDYVKPPSEGYEARECATIKVGDTNIAEALVERGLATIIKHRRDDENRSQAYDRLMIAEKKAQEEAKGLHSTKELPIIRISDASENAVKARQFLAFFKRGGRVNAVVDYVANGSRFFLLVPKENCRLAFVLSGIRCPRVGRNPGEKSDPFGAEALDFVASKALQRDVEVEFESVDKNGGFIGSLFLNHTDNVAVLLLEAGYAKIHESSADQSPYTNQLYSAERIAKAAQKGVWAGYEESADVATANDDQQGGGAVEAKRDYVDVVVTEIVDGGRFYVQIVNEDVHKLEKLMEDFSIHHSGASHSTDFRPKTNEVISAKFTADERWYRAKVRKHLPEQKSVEVVYVDYGNSEVIPLTRVRPLPPNFTQLPHQASEAVLSFLKVPAREVDYGNEAYERLQELTQDKQLVANIDYRESNVLSLTLYDPAQSQTPEASINADMVREGLATVNTKVWYARGNQATIKKLQEALEAAKSDRLGMFEYGDITADDD